MEPARGGFKGRAAEARQTISVSIYSNSHCLKMRGKSESTSHFLPRSFSLIQLDLFNTLFMTHRKQSPYCIMGSGGEIKTLIL